MIPYCSHTSGSGYVELMWNIPQYPPERYEVTCVCIVNSILLTNRHNDRVVNIRMANLTSNSTSVRVPKLSPNSICTLKLIAVYNPASIDPGIMITYITLAANTSKFNHLDGNFISTKTRKWCLLL